MKKVLFSNIREIFATLLIIITIVALFMANQANPFVIMILTLAVVLIWVFNFKTVQQMRFKYRDTMFELDKKMEEAQQAVDDVHVTAESFNKTISAFLAFNLADFQGEGRLGATIDWKPAAKFINEAREMSEKTGQMDVELYNLLEIGKAKVFEVFKAQNRSIFKEVSDEMEDYIHTGLSWQGGLKFDPNYFDIDFSSLAALVDKVPKEKQIYWQGEVKKLQVFYDQNFQHS